jgi:hypothetical protein
MAGRKLAGWGVGVGGILLRAFWEVYRIGTIGLGAS